MDVCARIFKWCYRTFKWVALLKMHIGIQAIYADRLFHSLFNLRPQIKDIIDIFLQIQSLANLT